MKKKYLFIALPFAFGITWSLMIRWKATQLDEVKHSELIVNSDSSTLKRDWEAEIQDEIAAMEYSIQLTENQNALSSPNRQNNLRVTYHDDGFPMQIHEKL